MCDRRTVRDFWFVKLGAIRKILTFYKQIFSQIKAFPVVVNRCTVMLCSMQYPFFHRITHFVSHCP